MKKKKQPRIEKIITAKKKHSKPDDEAWERLMKIREELRKGAASSEKPADEVMERLEKIGKELSKGWQSEKSAVEKLSEMRR